MDLDASISRYLNQWQHCPDKQLATVKPNIACECGQSWPWVNTLGETMEMLEWADEITRRSVSEVSGENQPGLF